MPVLVFVTGKQEAITHDLEHWDYFLHPAPEHEMPIPTKHTVPQCPPLVPINISAIENGEN